MDPIQRLNKFSPKVIDLSLNRINRLLDKLGNPQNSLPPVIHVAGTNGKGSTVAFIRTISELSGLQVHTYTSPHLVIFNERIRINGEIICDGELLDLIDEVETKNDGSEITFFEITTAIALLAFSRAPADLVLLETGLGGRLDATNVIPKPVLTILTPISLDHIRYLGTNLVSISAEKAAIMREGTTCVVAKQSPEALDIIRNTARRIGARLFIENEDWSFKVRDNQLNITTPDGKIKQPFPSLIGPHQLQNASLAIVSLSTLKDERITAQTMSNGLTNVEWPGRMHKLSNGPLINQLPKKWQLWIDGGHNPSAGRALARTLEGFKNLPVHLIIGVIASKDPSGFLKPLKKLTTSLKAISIPDEIASFPAEEICKLARKIGFKSNTSNSVRQAIKTILSENETPGMILICGSLYLAGKILRNNH